MIELVSREVGERELEIGELGDDLSSTSVKSNVDPLRELQHTCT